MKRLILTTVILTMGFICKAQYNTYYNPYLSASIAAGAFAETNDSYQLDNIRFDENAICKNPSACASYKRYLEIENGILKKEKIYEGVIWGGVGVICSSLIPICMCLDYDYDDPRSDTAINWSIGLLSGGSVMTIIGAIGWSVQIGKYKTNKKDFIYYLKTTNNGIGVVTIF